MWQGVKHWSNIKRGFLIIATHPAKEMSYLFKTVPIKEKSVIINDLRTNKYHDCLLLLKDRSELDFIAVHVKDLQIRYLCDGGIVW